MKIITGGNEQHTTDKLKKYTFFKQTSLTRKLDSDSIQTWYAKTVQLILVDCLSMRIIHLYNIISKLSKSHFKCSHDNIMYETDVKNFWKVQLAIHNGGAETSDNLSSLPLPSRDGTAEVNEVCWKNWQYEWAKQLSVYHYWFVRLNIFY